MATLNILMEVTVAFGQHHGRPQAWTGWGSTCPLEMLKSGFFVQMLSKTSVNKVFMHHFEKMSSSS